MDTLRTERLILGPLTPSDSEELFAARRDQEVMAFWDGPPDTTPSETAAIVELLLAACASEPLNIGVCGFNTTRAL